VRRYPIVRTSPLPAIGWPRTCTTSWRAGPAEIHIVVPATPTHEHLTWTEGAAHEVAERNLEAAIALFGELGAEVSGEVGDAHPMEAIRSALHGEPFDEIIVSTLPLGLSRWVKQDLPHRVRREFGLPVSHVVGEPGPPTSATPPHAGIPDIPVRETVVRLDVEGGDPDAP
jgi:hypothetical protein